MAITETQFETKAKLKQKLLGPYKISKPTGHERYEVEKIGNQASPSKTTTSADNIKLWPKMNMLFNEPNLLTPEEYSRETLLNIRKLIYRDTKFNTTIEGNIASGKTTLLQHLGNSTNTQVLTFREPLEKMTNIRGANLLDSLYNDTKKWIFF